MIAPPSTSPSSRVALSSAGFVATPLANQCSSLVRASADANALIVVPPAERNYERGPMVDVEIFDWETTRVA